LARARSRSWSWRFASPPQAIWQLLADTARFNEAAGLPNHAIEERPQTDGSVDYLGRARKGPFALEWRERPVNWVSGQWFEHRREFSRGPLAFLTASLRLAPEGTGSRGDYRIEAAAANPAGALILASGFFESAGRTFAKLAETADACAQGMRDTPFDYAAPEPGAEARARVDAAVRAIEASGLGHGFATRLGAHLLSAQEVELTRIRPLALARAWAADSQSIVELCLQATRAGLLELTWGLLCPRCRVAKATTGGLDGLARGAHCATCNIDYDRDFSRNVELSFRPSPRIRALSAGEYCLFGPMSTPHIKLHLTLEPGESREIVAGLAPGAYRLRTLEAGPQCDLEWPGGGFPEVAVDDDAVGAGAPAPDGLVRLTNRSRHRRTLVVEDRAWAADALTADRATSLQAFRDLCSDQLLRPGDEVAIARVALMFTDLRASTALYAGIGDAPAFHLVRAHFAWLAGIVRQHNGAIVKTIGDAIMAAFAEPADGLAAALAIQEGIAQFNAENGESLIIKVGLHEGACIAVTLNDRLDYFGTTVNMAARLQGESRGGDVVLSAEIAADPAVAALLDGRRVSPDEARLKGFAEPVAFHRLVFAQRA